MIRGPLASRYGMSPLGRGVIRESGVWLPTDIAGCTLWIDFSDTSTLFTDAGTTNVSADNDLIYQANDKSTNNLHLSQATEGLRLFYKTNQQNGLSVAYVGTDAFRRVTRSINVTSNITVFLITKSVDATTGRYMLDFPQNKSIIRGYTSGKYEWYSSPRTVIGTVDISKYQNISTAVGSCGNGTWGIGSSSGGTSNCYFGEVIVYASALSPENQALVNSYLNTKWAIT